jgi:DNA-directed RNA polymerase omega subunit
MERYPERIDSRFRFVLLAATRAEQMMRGAVPKVEMGQAKVTRIAMREIEEDRVLWDYGPAPVPAPEGQEGAPAPPGPDEA